MVDGDVPVGLRLDPTTVLVRQELPDDVAWASAPVAAAVEAAGYLLCDEETLFATPVAIQVLGLTYSVWDLWGRDLDAAFESLRVAAMGEAWDPVLATFNNDPGGTE